MSVRIARIATAATALMAATQLAAQGTASAALPPIRTLAKATASSTELMGAVSQVRALPGGRVLVNDNLGRKVVLFEPGLNAYKIVADTTSATANAYSSRAGGLIAFKGDSTLFVDPVSLSMLVIDGQGNVARVISVPRPNEAGSLVGGPNGTPGFDAEGRLVYRAPPNLLRITPPAPGTAPGAFQMPQLPDSVAVVRIALDTRKVDTVAFIKTQKVNMQMTQAADGRMSMSSIINPMQVIDDWAVTADGRVAIVRGQEYKIDWVDGNGAIAASNKVPFAWRKLDDSTKAAFIDSTKSAMEKLREQAQARAAAGGAGAPIVAGGAGPAGAGPAMAMTEMRFMGEAGPGGGGRGAAPGASAGGPPPSGGPINFTIPPLQFVNPSELPDYAPPFAAGAVRGDVDGNIWIRTSNVYDGGSVYDVVNAKGELTDRILLPAGRVIAGFGPGVVYMGYRDGDGVRLEMAPIHGATP